MKPSRTRNGRIKFGTEASGGFRNCTVANCTFRSCRGLALEEVDGGIMENITINNLTMMDVPDYAIYITTGKRNRAPGVDHAEPGAEIFISNVIADGVGRTERHSDHGPAGAADRRSAAGKHPAHLQRRRHAGRCRPHAAGTGTGYPEPGRDGTMPAYGVFARHVRGLELANINLSLQDQ